MGDSITQQSFGVGGWGARVADWYSRRADVINRGFSGYNTRWARHHLATIANTMPSGGAFTFATLFLGANDCAGNHQHVPVPEFKANLKAIVGWMRGLGIERVLLITPPPMAPEKHIAARGLTPEQETRSDEAHATYGAAVREVGAALKLPVVDLRQEMRDVLGEQWRDGLWDGLHLSPSGNEICFNALRRALETHYPEVLPVDAAPLLLPYHGEPKLHSLPPFPADGES